MNDHVFILTFLKKNFLSVQGAKEQVRDGKADHEEGGGLLPQLLVPGEGHHRQKFPNNSHKAQEDGR